MKTFICEDRQMNAFTCEGCSKVKTPDGTPQNAPFIWFNLLEKKNKSYCCDCDDKLILNELLPRDIKKNNELKANDSLRKSQEEIKKMLTEEKLI